jgi:hypothetical protein
MLRYLLEVLYEGPLHDRYRLPWPQMPGSVPVWITPVFAVCQTRSVIYVCAEARFSSVYLPEVPKGTNWNDRVLYRLLTQKCTK